MSRGLEVPGRVHINTVNMPNGHAFPGVVPFQKPGGMDIVMAGGLSKLEWMAGMVAAGGIGSASSAEDVVNRAKDILTACNQPQAPKVNGAVSEG